MTLSLLITVCLPKCFFLCRSLIALDGCGRSSLLFSLIDLTLIHLLILVLLFSTKANDVNLSHPHLEGTAAPDIWFPSICN